MKGKLRNLNLAGLGLGKIGGLSDTEGGYRPYENRNYW